MFLIQLVINQFIVLNIFDIRGYLMADMLQQLKKEQGLMLVVIHIVCIAERRNALKKVMNLCFVKNAN